MNNEDREYLIQENEILVSTTDMSGKITYADDNFVRVSGYSRDELLGSPHNIVRHPDMPKEVFKDFWREINLGNCWSGIIKNRQKNGGYYWVKSDVTPLYKDGVQLGFMSVRSMPNKVDLEKVKIQYSQFNEGEQGDLVIKRGKVVKKQHVNSINALSIKQRLFGLVLIATISLFTVLGIGIHSSYTEKEAVEHLYNNHIESYSRLLTIDKLWIENRLLLQSLLLTDDFEKHLNISKTLKDNALTLKQITTNLIDKFDLEHTSEIERYRIIAEQSDQLAATSLLDIYSTLSSSDESRRSNADFRSLILASVTEILAYEQSIGDLILENRQQSIDIYEESKYVFWFEVALSSIITLLCIVAYLIFAFIFNRDINSRLSDIRRYFTRLVKKDYLFEINIEKNDEIGQVLQSLKIMKVQLAYNMESVRQKAIAATRIKIALDNVSTNMMIVDNDNTIIYVNPSIIDMFTQAEKELKAYSPDFDANRLLGVNINDLNLVTIHQQNRLSNNYQQGGHDTPQTIEVEQTQEIDINGRIFNIVSNPVIDESGKQIGYVTEWADRTIEIGSVRQKARAAMRIKIALDNVSTNMMIVDSDNIIIYVNPSIINMFKHAEAELKAYSPDFDTNELLGVNINDLNLIKINQQDKHDTQQTVEVEKNQEIDINGRIFNIISNPVIDEAGKQIGYVTEWVDRTAEIGVEKEIEHVIQSAVEGDFSQRMALDGKNTFFTMLCGNMNRLLEISEVSLTDIVTVLSSLAKGDLTSKITADYSGAFGELKTSSNLTVTKLKEMILHIKISADTINTATKEIAIGNIDLAQRTEKQARSLEVTSSSMEELTITVKQNSEHSKQANRLAKDTSANALKGGEVVKQVVENMSDIHTSSQEVMNIISVIDSIAFQTNILALNAAVEAARAGEQGRGFAVVATEVRNLAQRSAAAAKEVKSLINSSVRKIEVGSKLATQAGDSISSVVISIQEVAQLIEEITQASVEQSVGIDQVTRSILEVDDVTQQNSALVEEGSAAASSLEEQVANLAVYVAAFDTGEQQLPPQHVASESHFGERSMHVALGSHNHADDSDWSEF
ncbi:methyl-accepting chemotaxis protein [Vibrio sp. ZSDZ65]|uniref:Methyl-accepting chemotaxis protein n=1 Tax=Vibrio qingdaonensis TaxID=2829491 RepID=A0A9X3CPS3_9VIBR|nr:methyl-accepting chemotaxis protein [Vibrio qingdaonensis]MCW8347140.1 methyl-accepting chemotaxis protein [Vibrio qingdaonensis]